MAKRTKKSGSGNGTDNGPGGLAGWRVVGQSGEKRGVQDNFG